MPFIKSHHKYIVAYIDLCRAVKVIYLQDWPGQEIGREGVSEDVILSWEIQNNKELATQTVCACVHMSTFIFTAALFTITQM